MSIPPTHTMEPALTAAAKANLWLDGRCVMVTVIHDGDFDLNSATFILFSKHISRAFFAPIRKFIVTSFSFSSITLKGLLWLFISALFLGIPKPPATSGQIEKISFSHIISIKSSFCANLNLGFNAILEFNPSYLVSSPKRHDETNILI